MKLARKLTAALAAGILVVMALYALFQIHQEIALSDDDLLRAQRVGRAWLGTIEAVWEREGPDRARELARRATERAGDIELRIMSVDEILASTPLSAEERGALLSHQLVRRVRTDGAGPSRLEVFVQMRVANGTPMAVKYVEPHHQQDSFIRMNRFAIIGATLGIVAVCGLIASALQYSLVGRPLQMLRDKARRAGEGDFDNPLELRQKDEIGELAREVNAMCDRIAAGNRRLAEETDARIHALEQLRHTDRLATVGQLAAGVAHGLGNPLSVVSARAELIGETELPYPEVKKNARLIGEQCDRMTAIIQQLLDFSRRRADALEVVDLRDVVARTCDLLSTAADRARARLRVDTPEAPIAVRIDRNQIQQALANVILNGIQAMRDGGAIRVSAETARAHPPNGDPSADADHARVVVEDAGAGIAPEHLDRLFEPFFTTKRVGEGTGLGLPVAHGIVSEHGGWFEVDSRLGGGTRFTIWLPLARAERAAAAGAA